MRARKTIGFLVIALVTALVGVWLYALVGSGAQLESLFRPQGSAAPAEPARASPVVERSRSLTVEAPPVSAAARDGTRETVQADADSAEAEAADAPAGPIDAGAFAELLESGLFDGEDGDPAAAEELRDSLRQAAESAAAREPE